jgi:hypothetical protein
MKKIILSIGIVFLHFVCFSQENKVATQNQLSSASTSTIKKQNDSKTKNPALQKVASKDSTASNSVNTPDPRLFHQNSSQ